MFTVFLLTSHSDMACAYMARTPFPAGGCTTPLGTRLQVKQSFCELLHCNSRRLRPWKGFACILHDIEQTDKCSVKRSQAQHLLIRLHLLVVDAIRPVTQAKIQASRRKCTPGL